MPFTTLLCNKSEGFVIFYLLFTAGYVNLLFSSKDCEKQTKEKMLPWPFFITNLYKLQHFSVQISLNCSKIYVKLKRKRDSVRSWKESVGS